MDKLNKEEKECIINYTDDLVSIMHEEKSSRVCDGKNTYTENEICTIRAKIESM